MRSFFISLSFIALVAACSSRDPVDDQANGASLPAPANEAAPDPTGTPPSNAAAPVAPAKASIPAAIQGRWGLTPADCEAGRADAKGLLTITADRIAFYESRATPGADVQFEPRSMVGMFNFTGEGQSWSKFQSLRADGNKLVRTETDPSASFNYARC